MIHAEDVLMTTVMADLQYFFKYINIVFRINIDKNRSDIFGDD